MDREIEREREIHKRLVWGNSKHHIHQGGHDQNHQQNNYPSFGRWAIRIFVPKRKKKINTKQPKYNLYQRHTDIYLLNIKP